MNLDSWSINYDEVLRTAGDGAPDDYTALARELSDAWARAYRRSVPHASRLYVITMKGFEYIFDDASPDSQTEKSAENELICERVVAVYGRSQPADGTPRRASRIRGFPRGAASGPEVVGTVRHDRGHMMAHASGGGEDINLFPQLADVNRGCSREGRNYRRMERLLAASPGTFCFSRPVYSGPTDHPYLLEFGLLQSDCDLRVERFPNCRSLAEMQAIEDAVAAQIRARNAE